MAPRIRLAALTLTLVLPTLALAQPGGRGERGAGGGGAPGGFGGMGGRGGAGGMFDPSKIFDWISGGKDTINVGELDQMKKMIVERMGLTGTVTRDQFKEAQTKAMEKMAAGGGMGAFGGGGGMGGIGGAGGRPGGPGGGPGGFGGGRGPGGGNDIDGESERLFRRLDKDGDGLLKVDELGERMETLANEREKWDTNNDGLIELSEFKPFYAARRSQLMSEIANSRGSENKDPNANPDDEPDRRPVIYRAGKLPKDLPEWWVRVDTNYDGQVSIAEWRASSKPIEDFKSMDHSGDNLLTIEETVLYVRLKNNGHGSAVASNSPSPGRGLPGMGMPGMGMPAGMGSGAPGLSFPGMGTPGGGGIRGMFGDRTGGAGGGGAVPGRGFDRASMFPGAGAPGAGGRERGAERGAGGGGQGFPGVRGFGGGNGGDQRGSRGPGGERGGQRDSKDEPQGGGGDRSRRGPGRG